MSTGDTSSTTLSDMLKTPSSAALKPVFPRRVRRTWKKYNSSSTKSMKFVRGTENHGPLFCHTCVLLAMQRRRLSSMRSLKRFQSGEKLLGEETFSKYVESLRVPDLILLYFKTKARISGNTWQAVLNITKLGRTEASLRTIFLKFSWFTLRRKNN